MRLILLLLLTLHLYAQRIVALSPAIADILFALERGDEVVGVSDYTFYPKEAAELPKVGGYFEPNIEKILLLKPTLVIAQSLHSHTLEQLQHLGIATQSVALDSIDNIKKTIHALAGSHPQKAKAVIASIDSSIANAHSKPTNTTVIIVFGLFDDLRDNIYISGTGLFFNEIIEICGAKNAYTSSLPPQPVLNYEALITLNPDRVLILNSNLTSDTKKALKTWNELPIKAAKEKKIRLLNYDFISLPSQRIAKSIEIICGALHD
jgi:iron complex transport system substrate-binding protein